MDDLEGQYVANLKIIADGNKAVIEAQERNKRLVYDHPETKRLTRDLEQFQQVQFDRAVTAIHATMVEKWPQNAKKFVDLHNAGKKKAAAEAYRKMLSDIEKLDPYLIKCWYAFRPVS